MRRPFVFQLASILRYRIQQEEQARLAFSQARTRYMRQGQLVRELAEKLVACHEQLIDQATMTQADLWLWGNYKQGLERDHEDATTLLGEYAQEVETRRAELLVCAKNKKLLEQLQANQAREHEINERAIEQKESDETATLRFGKTYS